MAKDDAGQGLDLDVLETLPLNLGEIPDLGLGELYILAFLRGEAVDASVDLSLAEAIVVAFPAIELDRHLAHRDVTAFLDVGQRRLDDIAHLSIGVGLRLRRRAVLQPDRHLPTPCSAVFGVRSPRGRTANHELSR